MNRARTLAAAAVVPCLLATVAAGTAAGAARADAPAPVAAPAERPSVPHCITMDGTDLNEFYDVKYRIIGPSTCRTAVRGEKWVRTVSPWFTAPGAAGAVYPEGYRPSRPAPIDDFNSKFVSATYVQDRGTDQEKSITFKKKEVLRTGFTDPTGLPFSTVVSAPLKSLDVGPHTSTVLFTLKAEHCDGLGTVREENCLPAGTFLWAVDTPFEVVPRPGQAAAPAKHAAAPRRG
ncbi:hypothetical protein [Streptomyces sp. NPDC048603]|uniref:hypothetical protein n=1 Tax=Streptomyces sp. NPDC048603 TaxID=3365577 RepID=UPI0037107DF1